MDPRLQTPTVLTSRGFSPPPPEPAASPLGALQSQPHNLVEEEEDEEDEYGSSNTSSNDLTSVYEGGKSTAQGTVLIRQPLQEATGNAQYQHHQHHATQASHYPPPYHLPSLPSTRSCTPIHPHHHQQQHHFGGPLAPLPPSARTQPAVTAILQSNSHSHSHNNDRTLASDDAVDEYQHRIDHLETQSLFRITDRIPSPLRLRLAGIYKYPPSNSNLAQQRQLVIATPGTATTLGNGSRVAMLQMDLHPFKDTPEFKAYRVKQQKDKDKLTWGDFHEGAFLFSMLVVPNIGRRKCQLNKKAHGRNMMISVYIYQIWRFAQEDPDMFPKFPPDEKYLNAKDYPEIAKKWTMFRRRKQVSSHAQVIKEFFKPNWAYLFFFVKGEEPGSKDKDKNKIPVPLRWYQNNTDQRNLNKHPVNVALNEGQLPPVRANFAYFGQLLAVNKHVQIRPSVCCIYVANKNLRDQPSTGNSPGSSQLLIKDESKPFDDNDGVKHEESQQAAAALGYNSANPNPNTVVNTYHSNAGLLFKSDYPHRYALNNPPRDSDPAKSNPWADREVHARDIRQTLLHEYAFDLKQTESSAAREVLDEWRDDHPVLHDKLQRVITEHDLLNVHMLPPSRMCDIIHVDVTLDIHRVRCLPEGTSLEWFFKISVDQERLQGHDWSVRSFLDRPEELARRKSGKVKDGMVMTQADNAMHFQATHVRGCSDDNPQCTCRSRNRNTVWLVPTMADTWAEALDLCARFPRYLVPKKPGTSRTKKEDDMPESDTVTQMDLMKSTAMFQELWSSAPVSPASGEQRKWTRRAVICWTFNTIDFFDKEKNHCETPAQTTWRFLSAIDPLSKAHLDRIYLPTSSDNESNGNGTSPSYQQILNTDMTENLTSAWNLNPSGVHSTTTSMPVSPIPSYGPPPLSFSHGLVTPPASATLPSNYVFEGLPNVMPQHALASQQMGYLPGTSVDHKASFATGDSFNTDPYLQGTQYSNYYHEGEDNESDTTLQGDSADLTGFDTQWSNMNSSAHIANAAVPDWSHNGLHSLSMVAEEMAGHRDPKSGQDVQHLPPCTDFLAHLQTDPRTDPMHDYVRHGEQRLQSNRERRKNREQILHHELPGQDEDHDGWNTAENPSSTDQAAGSQSFSQDSSAHHSQSTTGTWADGLSQIHHSQPLRDEDLTMPAPRAVQGYGTASLSPLLNRKRLREDDDDEAHSNAYPMPSYVAREASRYAPVVDGENSQGWP